MKLAVLSDIHSNYVALEACYDYLNHQNIDGIIYLGDYLCDCPYPQKTMELITDKSTQYPSWFVRGNREEYFINHHEKQNDGWKYSSSSGSLLYTYENITHTDIEFFKKCEPAATIDLLGSLQISICHGSPSSSREHLYMGSDLTHQYLKTIKTNYLLCGHTHKQFAESAYGKTIINPGSVGLPTNRQTHSQFAILHGNHQEWTWELISVEYDIEKILSDFETSGIHEKAKIWSRMVCKCLRTGEDYSRLCLDLAWKLASEAGSNRNPWDISEEYWHAAGKQLGII